jgi:hypothetical protein
VLTRHICSATVGIMTVVHRPESPVLIYDRPMAAPVDVVLLKVFGRTASV